MYTFNANSTDLIEQIFKDDLISPRNYPELGIGREI